MSVTPAKSAQTLARASALLDKGDVGAAERLISATWPKPNEAPAGAFHLLGLIRRAQRRNDEAVGLLRMAVKMAPAEAGYHFALGDVLAIMGDASAAADTFKRALELDPDLANARRALGRMALNAGRFEEAEAAARRLIETSPDADAWTILSSALRGQERLEEAALAGEEAIRLDPDSVAARHDWAVAIGRLGRVEEALAAFEALAAQGARASALAVNRSAALLELERAEEAEAVLVEAIALWPADMGLQIALAKARWIAGAGEAFTEIYEDAVARNPAAPLFRVGCVDLLRAAGFIERAEAMLQNGLQKRPSDPILLDAYGVLLDETDRVAEALPLLRRALIKAPAREELRSRFVRALLRLGRGDEALAEIAPLRLAAPLHQHWLALESLTLKQLGDPRYHWLCDYELMIGEFQLQTPHGFADAGAFNQALAASLGRFHTAREHPLGQTLRQGTQTTRNLTQVDDAIIAAYLGALREPIRAYIDRMRDSDHPWSGRKSADFKLSGAWSVRLKPNGFHVNHIHTGGWISSSYYVALPEGVGQSSAQEGWIKFGEPPKPIPGCGIEKVVQPKVGGLVLFPSYMWHGTIPIASGERLTAPFDVVPL